jgi:hypothetical protein
MSKPQNTTFELRQTTGKGSETLFSSDDLADIRRFIDWKQPQEASD